MKISELIAELEKAMAEHGDIDTLPVKPQLQRWWLDEVEQKPYIALQAHFPEQWTLEIMGSRDRRSALHVEPRERMVGQAGTGGVENS